MVSVIFSSSYHADGRKFSPVAFLYTQSAIFNKRSCGGFCRWEASEGRGRHPTVFSELLTLRCECKHMLNSNAC